MKRINAAARLEHKSTRLFLAVLTGNFFLNFGFNIWQAVFNNFAVEELGVTAQQIGFLQSWREIPGLLSFVLGFVALFMSEMSIMGISIFLLGMGLVLTSWTNGMGMLLTSVMVMSIGFHFFYPSSNAAVMLLKERDAAKGLGRLNSVGAAAAVAATAWVYFTVDTWGYRQLFLVTGILSALGAVVVLPLRREKLGHAATRKVIFRRQYWLYYLLTFLMGSRRHIFSTFAVFLLVAKFGISAPQVAILFLINSVMSVYVYEQFGRLVTRFGERKILICNFVLLIFVFAGYAFVNYLPILYVLFIIDNLLFGFSVALKSYFQKIAVSSEEITANVALDQTFNHIVALFMPVWGGFLWAAYGSAATFVFGIVLIIVALIATQWMNIPQHAPALPQ